MDREDTHGRQQGRACNELMRSGHRCQMVSGRPVNRRGTLEHPLSTCSQNEHYFRSVRYRLPKSTATACSAVVSCFDCFVAKNGIESASSGVSETASMQDIKKAYLRRRGLFCLLASAFSWAVILSQALNRRIPMSWAAVLCSVSAWPIGKVLHPPRLVPKQRRTVDQWGVYRV